MADTTTRARVLVGYASRHGSTAGIAVRIAARLRDAGVHATARDVEEVDDLHEYDAFVIGGATYMFHWLKPATTFARRHVDVLSTHPVWLFSSGPLGDQLIDDDGMDVLATTRPKEFDELHDLLQPRDEHVFFGAWDPETPPVGLLERAMRMLPATDAIPAGDFRDWHAIDGWADEIAAALVSAV